MESGYEVLSNAELLKLREHGIISSSEIALKVGDLFVAENVSTKERRVLNNALSVLSESKRILKG